MPRKSIRETLHKVDPRLKVIPGGVRHRRVGQANWKKAAGVICSNCRREVFRSRDGLCIECWEKENEFEIRDKAGVLEFLPESVIMEIVHPAKKES